LIRRDASEKFKVDATGGGGGGVDNVDENRRGEEGGA